MVWHARYNWITASKQSAAWPATSTAARCVSCKAFTLKAMEFVTTYWYTRLVDWWAETR